MGLLDGRVAIVTGAGRGLGRAHALALAQEGAKVVVNDRGGSPDGSGSDSGPAHEVAHEITAMGGEAVANTDDIADWKGAQQLVAMAVEAFGGLHVLVNNAGILRDRTLVNMSEAEWDAVINVHLKGTFAMSRWAAAYWRDQAKAGNRHNAAIVNTSSASGLHGIPGQTNYGAAKAGILILSIVAAAELARYGIRVNAICPGARTRLTAALVGAADQQAHVDESGWDKLDPANISPLVVHLAREDCPLTGQVYSVAGGRVSTYRGWTEVDAVDRDARWDPAELGLALEKFPIDLNPLFGAG